MHTHTLVRTRARVRAHKIYIYIYMSSEKQILHFLIIRTSTTYTHRYFIDRESDFDFWRQIISLHYALKCIVTYFTFKMLCIFVIRKCWP